MKGMWWLVVSDFFIFTMRHVLLWVECMACHLPMFWILFLFLIVFLLYLFSWRLLMVCVNDDIIIAGCSYFFVAIMMWPFLWHLIAALVVFAIFVSIIVILFFFVWFFIEAHTTLMTASWPNASCCHCCCSCRSAAGILPKVWHCSWAGPRYGDSGAMSNRSVSSKAVA